MSENIHTAMAAVNRGIDAIAKDDNSPQGWKFRGIDAAYNSLHDLLAQEGIVTLPRVVDQSLSERVSAQGKPLFVTRLMVEYDFIHESGTKVTAGPVMGEAMDSGDKGANKCLAVAHKYVLFQTFTIPTLFTDPDAEVHEVQVADPVHEDQTVELIDLQEYIPEVTLEWMAGRELSSHQAEVILEKAREEYAKAAA